MRLGILLGGWLLSLALVAMASMRHTAERLERHAPHRPEIHVSAEMFRALAADHRRLSGQDPSAAEHEALVDQYVTREVLYREALALGLDEDDMIVRRRLVQKMEALLDAVVAVEEPSADEISAHLEANRARYREPERIALRHVFIADRTDRGRAEALLGALDHGAEGEELGDPFIRGRRFAAQPVEAFVGIFGSEFSESLVTLPTGRWTGPVESSFGLHLVWIDERIPPRDPPREELAARISAELQEKRRAEARLVALAEMRDRYTVEVDR